MVTTERVLGSAVRRSRTAEFYNWYVSGLKLLWCHRLKYEQPYQSAR